MFELWNAIWVFPKIGVPQNEWFIMENPIKMGWFGVKKNYFWKHPFVVVLDKLLTIFKTVETDMDVFTAENGQEHSVASRVLHSPQAAKSWERCCTISSWEIEKHVVSFLNSIFYHFLSKFSNMAFNRLPLGVVTLYTFQDIQRFHHVSATWKVDPLEVVAMIPCLWDDSAFVPAV